MPSAARQRLPADLWRQGHWKSSSSSPPSFYHGQEIQACPGQNDTYQDDKQKFRQGNKNKSQRKQFIATGRGSPKSQSQRGSADALNNALTDSGRCSGVVDDKSDMTVLSTSAKSDSFLNYKVSQESDAYAMESSIAPHPSQVPLPPLEWLQSSSRRSLSPAFSGISLQAILGCQVAA